MTTTETDAPASPRVFHCSFCAKSQHEVALLINGPGVFICDECVALCEQIFETEAPAAGSRDLHSVETLDDTRLLHMLGTSQQATERIDEAMHDIVDVLRERGVSWATIGESLSVTRQAAWKRFG